MADASMSTTSRDETMVPGAVVDEPSFVVVDGAAAAAAAGGGGGCSRGVPGDS